MAWSPPRTWNPGETVTASLMNAHVRDNFNILKTNVDDEGYLRTLLAAFAYGGGGADSGVNANAVGGADTELTGYPVVIPANFLDQPGDGLVLEGSFVTSAQAGQKTAKVQVEGSSLGTFVDTTGVNDIIHFRISLRRRDSTTGALGGISWQDAAAGDTPNAYNVNAAITGVDWTVAQDLKILLAGAVMGEIFLTDYLVDTKRVITGISVP